MIVNPQAPKPVLQHCDAVTILPESIAGGTLSEAMPAASCIGDYVIIEEIARGGMGVVYLAQHRHLGRRVALKTLLLDCGEDTSSSDRFAIEAEAIARLDHPGIVAIYEVGEYRGQPFLAMKLIDGGNLAKLLHDGPLDSRRALGIAIEVAEAIAHAHQRNVIHRDLKPANILLDQAGHAVITDFGVAKFVEAAQCHLTTAGEPIGTPHYMPPEQADATRGPISAASDVYSIGAMMYAMLTGRPPFQAASPMDVLLQVLANDPVPPRQLNSTVPVTFEAIVMKCLQKDANRRYQTATELADDLSRFRDGKPTIAKPIRGVRWTLYYLRKHFMVATVSGSVVTLLLLATLIVLIAHVKLLKEKTELETNVADLADVLASERTLLRARVSGLRKEQVSEAELAAERLASYSSYIEKQNPDLAARLAIESIHQSRQASRSVEASAVGVLRASLAKRTPDSKGIYTLPNPTDADISTMIEEIEKSLTYQLSQDQRVLFGIETPTEQARTEPLNRPTQSKMENR